MRLKVGFEGKMRFAKVIDGKHVGVECHESLRLQAKWLLDLVDTIVTERGHKVLSNGYMIEFGWSMLQIGAAGSDNFDLLEPDYRDDPFRKWRKDISSTLIVQQQQNDFVLQVGAEPQSTSFQDKVVYCKSVFSQRRVYLERQGPRPNDSGWFIGDGNQMKGEYAADELAACYAYELLKYRPEVVKVLQLPTGYLVIFDGSCVEAVLAPDNQLVYPR